MQKSRLDRCRIIAGIHPDLQTNLPTRRQKSVKKNQNAFAPAPPAPGATSRALPCEKNPQQMARDALFRMNLD
jgi:hypothetical protein